MGIAPMEFGTPSGSPTLAPAALGGSRNAPDAPSAADAARDFVEDLIQLGRLQPGNAKGIVANMSPARTDRYSHTLEQTDKGMVLKRLHFDCGLCDHDHPLA